MTAPLSAQDTAERLGKPRETLMNSSSSASVRWRFVAPALALSLAGSVLGGCVRPERPPQWNKMGEAYAWDNRSVYRDAAGCYWLDDNGPQRPLMTGKKHDTQWCDAPPSERTAPSVAPGSAKTGSTR